MGVNYRCFFGENGKVLENIDPLSFFFKTRRINMDYSHHYVKYYFSVSVILV